MGINVEIHKKKIEVSILKKPINVSIKKEAINVGIVKKSINVNVEKKSIQVHAKQSTRIVYIVEDEASRLSIPTNLRYDGMIVYQKSPTPSKYYSLNGGITNDDWQEFGSGGTIDNITEIANRSYNDLQNLPTLGTMASQSAGDYQLLSEKGQPSGYTPLNASGKIPTQYIPDIAISEYQGDFADLATALADAGVQASQRGDWFTVQTDGGYTYIAISDNPTVAGDVRIMANPTDAISNVNGKTGVVVLDTDDIAEGATNLYWTQARFNTAFGNKTTDNLPQGLTNLYNQTHTGDVTGATVLTIANGAVTYDKLATSVQDSLNLADSALQSGDNISELANDVGYVIGPNGAKDHGVAIFDGITGELLQEAGNNHLSVTGLQLGQNKPAFAWLDLFTRDGFSGNEIAILEQYHSGVWSSERIYHYGVSLGTRNTTPVEDKLNFTGTTSSTLKIEFRVIAQLFSGGENAVIEGYAKASVDGKGIHTVDDVVIQESNLGASLAGISFDIVATGKQVWINGEMTGLATSVGWFTRYTIYELRS